MNTCLSLRFLLIVTVVIVCPMIAFADANLTPEQLVLLMEASREQYNTISAKMKALSYQYDPNNKAEPKLKMTRDIVSRWTREKSFSRTVRTSYPDTIPHKDYTPTIISTYAITPKWSKRLIEAPDNRTPRGYIKPGGSLEEDQPFYTIYTAMWDIFSWTREQMNLHKATITRDEKNNYYVVKLKMGSSQKGPMNVLWIDASKSFIPVKREFLKHDGTLLIRCECSDFRQTENGLWIPYRYSWFDPRANYGAIYEAEQVVVNQPIHDNLLDFTFPTGTIVRDDICSMQYIISDVIPSQDTVVDPCSLAKTDVSVTVPVRDEELLASALKAKELLQTYATAVEALPTIEMLPPIVLVTANKYEYTLSVSKSDGTKPQLLGHKFESDTFEFLSLKDLIQDKSQLIVTIKRLQSHTGFASGTLLLQYAGEDKSTKVTFVSAPLPNAP